MVFFRNSVFFLLFVTISSGILKAQDLPSDDRIQSELITSDADELILKQLFIVDAPVEKVWAYFTEEELYQQWSAPVVEIEMKINGKIRANYRPGGSLEDDDTITIHILNYIPEKLITLQSEIPETFPAFIKQNEKNFYNITEFNETESGGTEIISYGLGYKNTDQFQEVISFFAQGNLQSYQKLIGLLE